MRKFIILKLFSPKILKFLLLGSQTSGLDRPIVRPGRVNEYLEFFRYKKFMRRTFDLKLNLLRLSHIIHHLLQLMLHG